jgi:hypothetical protein
MLSMGEERKLHLSHFSKREAALLKAMKLSEAIC